MKNQFKILLLMLITSVMVYGQSHQILKESIKVNRNATIVLNFENIYVAIEESTDGKIHFDYVIEFEGYSKNDIQKKLDGVSANVSNFDNGITLTAKSENQISFESYEFKTDYGISINESYSSKKNDSIIRKSKDSLIAEIRINNKFQWTKNPLKFINDRFKKVDKNGKLSNIGKRNFSIMRSQFVIKIPPFVKININSKNSSVTFRNDFRNELNITIKDGSLRAKELMNPLNRIKLDKANFESISIIGGNYNFINVKKGKIGSIEKVEIQSEFSEIEIGEIKDSNVITDFNSEYWLYNWAKAFGRFDLYSEYSKVHFFYPKLDYRFAVIGHNTKNFIGKHQINMQSTSEGEKYRMMERKPKGEGELSGEIFFDIVDGIIYSHKDSLKTINK